MTDDQDGGFGVVEVIVSMVIFALLALALAPVLIGGVRASIKMTSIATATQFVNQGLESARASLPPGSPCPAATAPPTLATITDARGVALRRAITVTPDSACATSKRVHVEVTVVAVDATPQFAAGQTISEARTLVFLG